MERQLVLPGNYVELESNEMMYLEGGWSWSNLGQSLSNLYNKYSFARRALIGTGITTAVISSIGRGTATGLYWTIAGALGSIAAANWVVGAVIGVSAAAAIWAMGEWVQFR